VLGVKEEEELIVVAAATARIVYRIDAEVVHVSLCVRVNRLYIYRLFISLSDWIK